MAATIITTLIDNLARSGMAAREHVRLSEVTTFRLGGPCLGLIECRLPEQLEFVTENLDRLGLEFVLIGGGSNLLVSDQGLNALVVRYASDDLCARRKGEWLDVDAGASLDELARFAVEEGLAGLVYCSGIPGTVGGAVAGNAGAFGKQLGDHVVSVRVMDRRGKVYEVPGSQLEFAYRSSRLAGTGEIVLSVQLQLERGSVESLRTERMDILALRKEKHPDWRKQPTAGSFFKNIEPTSAAGRRQAAGWFLEQAGAKGMRVGGARVFEKHANIIVAGEGCKAQDVLDLSRQMADAVKTQFGLNLEREVRVLGMFA